MNTSNQLVRVTVIPPGLPQDALNTHELFAKCLGHSFEMVDRNGNLIELAVVEIMGVAPNGTEIRNAKPIKTPLDNLFWIFHT
jgi:hypothetical protein